MNFFENMNENLKNIKKKIKAIIFDVDGVIFNTHDEKGNYRWSRDIKKDLGLTSIHLVAIFSEKWESIIMGKIDFSYYLETLFEDRLFQNISITPQQFIQYWFIQDQQVHQDILDFVKSLKIPCYLGTNQEALRTCHILNTVGSYFKGCFAYYKTGFIKPEKEFFQYIQTSLSLLSHELLLIDDTKNNILAAQDCGWHGYHYQNDTKNLTDFLLKNQIF